MFHMITLEQTFVNSPFAKKFLLLLLLNRIDSIPASEKAGTLYLRIYPYVDPDKITTMFLFLRRRFSLQSGNAKSSIKGNTLNSDSLNRKSPCSSSLYILLMLHAVCAPFVGDDADAKLPIRFYDGRSAGTVKLRCRLQHAVDDGV